MQEYGSQVEVLCAAPLWAYIVKVSAERGSGSSRSKWPSVLQAEHHSCPGREALRETLCRGLTSLPSVSGYVSWLTHSLTLEVCTGVASPAKELE